MLPLDIYRLDASVLCGTIKKKKKQTFTRRRFVLLSATFETHNRHDLFVVNPHGGPSPIVVRRTFSVGRAKTDSSYLFEVRAGGEPRTGLGTTSRPPGGLGSDLRLVHAVPLIVVAHRGALALYCVGNDDGRDTKRTIVRDPRTLHTAAWPHRDRVHRDLATRFPELTANCSLPAGTRRERPTSSAWKHVRRKLRVGETGRADVLHSVSTSPTRVETRFARLTKHV